MNDTTVATPVNDCPILRSLEHARAVKLSLVEQVQSIQAELSNKDVRLHGHRAGNKSYHQWRQNKIAELNKVLSQIRYVKDWITHRSSLPKSDGGTRHEPKPEEMLPTTPRGDRAEALEYLLLKVKEYIEIQRDATTSIDRMEQVWTEVTLAVRKAEMAG